MSGFRTVRIVVACCLLSVGCHAKPADPISLLSPNDQIMPTLRASPVLRAQVAAALNEQQSRWSTMPEAKARYIAVPIVNAFVHERLTHLDDPMLSRYAAIVANAVVKKITSKGDCMAPMQAKTESMEADFGADQVSSFTADLVNMSPDLNPAIATPDQAKAVILAGADDISNRTGIDMMRQVQIIGGSPQTTDEKCRFAAATFGYLSSLPPAVGAPVLRSMKK